MQRINCASIWVYLQHFQTLTKIVIDTETVSTLNHSELNIPVLNVQGCPLWNNVTGLRYKGSEMKTHPHTYNNSVLKTKNVTH